MSLTGGIADGLALTADEPGVRRGLAVKTGRRLRPGVLLRALLLPVLYMVRSGGRTVEKARQIPGCPFAGVLRL